MSIQTEVAFRCDLTYRELAVLARVCGAEVPGIAAAWLTAATDSPSEADDDMEARALEEAAVGLVTRRLVRPVAEGLQVCEPLATGLRPLFAPAWVLTTFTSSRLGAGFGFEITGNDVGGALIAPDGFGGVRLTYEPDARNAVMRSIEALLGIMRELVPDPPDGGPTRPADEVLGGLAPSDACLSAVSREEPGAPDADEFVWLRSTRGQYMLTRLDDGPLLAQPVGDAELAAVVTGYCLPPL